MKLFRILCTAAAVSLLAACNVNVIPPTDFTETRTFDLASPDPIGELPFIVEVDMFSNECSGRFKMVFREEANRIAVDDYNRWSMPPGSMLTKYLAARFAAHPGNPGRDNKPVFVVDGSVLNCELNKSLKQVDLLVHFFITEHNDESFRITGTEGYRIQVEDTTPEAFANGMSKAAAEFADHVVAVLKETFRKQADEEEAARKKK